LIRLLLIGLVAVLALGCETTPPLATPSASPVAPVFEVFLDRGVVLTVRDESGLLLAAHRPPLSPQELLSFVSSATSGAGRMELRDTRLIVGWFGDDCVRTPLMIVSDDERGLGLDVFDGPRPPGVGVCNQMGIPLGVSLEFAATPPLPELRRHQGTP
jgi:hypothetical protein